MKKIKQYLPADNSLLKTVLLLLGANAFANMTGSPYYGFIGVFYDGAGLTKPQIGVLLSVTAVASICIQPLWAWLSDHTGRRRRVLCVMVAGCAVSVLGFYLARGFPGYLLVALVYAAFLTAIGPLCDALVVDYSARVGANFGHIRVAGTVGYAVMVYLAGLLLGLDIRLLFALASGLYLLMLLVVSRLPKDVPAIRARRPKQSKRVPGQLHASGKKLFTGRRIGFVLAMALICQTGLSFYGAYLSIYMLELGYSEGLIGISGSIAALSEVPVLLLLSKHIKRWDSMRLLAFAGCALAVRIALVPAGSLPLMLLAQMMGGLTQILMYFVCVVYLNEHVAREKMSQAQSIYAIVTGGFGSAVGNIAGGYLVEYTGLSSAYLVASALMLGAVLLVQAAYLIYKKRGYRFFRRLPDPIPEPLPCEAGGDTPVDRTC